jgi:hypothetical protein
MGRSKGTATDLAPGEFWQIPPSREAGVNLFRRDLQGGTTVLITQNRSLSGGGSWNSGLATQRGEFNLTPRWQPGDCLKSFGRPRV